MAENKRRCPLVLNFVQAAVNPNFNWATDGYPRTSIPTLTDVTLNELDKQMQALGDFTRIGNNDLGLEACKQKIVVFGTKNQDNTFTPRHYALQLPDGKWISKLGTLGPTIIHGHVRILAGKPPRGYGDIIAVYSRPNDAYRK